MTDLAMLDRLHEWDQQAFLAVNRWLNSLADTWGVKPLLELFDSLGNPYVALLVAGCVVCLAPRLWAAARRVVELALLATLLVVIVPWIKPIFARSRPQLDMAELFESGDAVALFGQTWTHNSFPSGHTALAFGLASLLLYWAGQSALRHRRWFIGLHVFGLALCVGLARIAGGSHYPGDVLAGAALGMLCALVATTAVRLLLRRSTGPIAAASSTT